MEEYIFGTLITDELKLIHHRSCRVGLQHACRLSPGDPEPGHPVTLTVTLGPNVPADCIVCYYTLDGSVPAGARGVARSGEVARFEQVGREWDTLISGYLTTWQTTLPAQPEGAIVRYCIGAWADGLEETFGDWPNVKNTIEAAAKAHFSGKPVPHDFLGDSTQGDTFVYHVDRLAPPPWAREAVFYQIFVDRFSPGKGRDWQQTRNLQKFFGGTLWGVVENLDYIADLGATGIWLSPIFPSPSYHGYDTTDFFSVDARRGGDDALRALVSEAHARGIRIVLDLACNHVSNEHPIFKDAHANPKSPYRDWFTFDDSKVGYRSFFGIRTMPQLNVQNADARKWVLSIARFWLHEFDVDGYRLDHAAGPGPAFWGDFWAACKEEKPESFCFGEIVEPPDVIRQYVGRMDGALDFHVTDKLRSTFARRTKTEAQFEAFIAQHRAYFPEETFLLPTFIDNHDMDRFLYVASGDKETLRRAAAVQMQLPGPPIIYYGTEVGMSQPFARHERIGDEPCRMPMLWGGDQDGALLDYYKRLIAQRRKSRGAS